MFRKFMPLMAVVLLAGCATTPMADGTCCKKAEAKCQYTKCECKDCGSETCICKKKPEEGKTCMKKGE